MQSAIYIIENLITGKAYVGSAVKYKCRWNQHKYLLNANKHQNSHLQHAWNKYGKAAFKYSILEFIEKSKLLEIEQFYLDCNINFGYNLCAKAVNNLTYVPPKDTGLKISKANKGRKFSDEHKQNITKAQIGRKLSIEHREKISKNWEIRTVSDEARKNMSLSQTGRKHSEETKAKMKIAQKKRYEKYGTKKRPPFDWSSIIILNI